MENPHDEPLFQVLNTGKPSTQARQKAERERADRLKRLRELTARIAGISNEFDQILEAADALGKLSYIELERYGKLIMAELAAGKHLFAQFPVDLLPTLDDHGNVGGTYEDYGYEINKQCSIVIPGEAVEHLGVRQSYDDEPTDMPLVLVAQIARITSSAAYPTEHQLQLPFDQQLVKLELISL